MKQEIHNALKETLLEPTRTELEESFKQRFGIGIVVRIMDMVVELSGVSESVADEVVPPKCCHDGATVEACGTKIPTDAISITAYVSLTLLAILLIVLMVLYITSN